MDFQSLLDQASKNMKKTSKTLNALDSEVSNEKLAKIKRIEAEKRAKIEEARKKRLARPVVPEKKFVIPKKKNEGEVDANNLKAFLAKKELEKKESEQKKKDEKEKLIQLRLQSHGGKASKKLGKQFGMDPIDLQIRYGNDHSLVEQLQKRKWREEDEQDKLSSHYRDGVYRALAQKRQVIEKMKKSSSGERIPHRVSTSKANSLAGLSSRHASTRDHFSPPPSEKKTQKSAPMISKKRPTAPQVDFQTLMKTAERISKGLDPEPAKQNAASSSSSQIPKRPSLPDRGDIKSRSEVNSAHRSSSRSEVNSVHRSSSSHTRQDRQTESRNIKSAVSSRPVPSKSHSESSQKRDERKVSAKTSSSVPRKVSPPRVGDGNRRFLPGDMRYQGSRQVPEASQRPSASKNESAVPKTASHNIDRKRMTERSDMVKRPVSSYDSSSKHVQSSVAKKRRYEESSRSLLEKERAQERSRYMGRRAYEEEDDDEYDSEMDDFIDDTEMDDMNREEFENTLKMVNPKYNKRKWKERERMIDVRYMEANYETVSKEEARSSKIGMMEDIIEARNGKSHAL